MDYIFVFFNRLDISSVQGQSSRLSCILRGIHASRLVQCYSSHPAELQVSANVSAIFGIVNTKNNQYYKGTRIYDLVKQNQISSKNRFCYCLCLSLMMFSCCCR